VPLTRSERFGHSTAGSLATIVRSFKSIVSKCINDVRKTPGGPVWQRNYYEHVIRDEDSLQRIREYIVNNPQRWDSDRENPMAANPEAKDVWLG
jgi:putative transposase